jgi:predicted dehydrogenase
MSDSRLRFAVLGTGNIARQFAGSFRTSRRCVVSAVGSRTVEAARGFVEGQGLAGAAACGSYAEAIERDDVDAVYVSMPNSMHAEWTIRALEAGKHVLCEKPIAMSEAEARLMFAAAKRSGKLLVEAFMYVSHPLTNAYVAAVREGKIGRLRHVRTSFCYRTNKIDGNVRFDDSLGGGAIMDIGCYCVHFSRMIHAAAFGTSVSAPTRVHAEGVMHERGVDLSVGGLMRFEGDVTATFQVAMGTHADNTATIAGDDGYIEVPVPWKPPTAGAKWVLARGTPPKMDGNTPPAGSVRTAPPPREELTVSVDQDLYALEADHFAETVLGVRPPAVSEADSLANMAVLDELRRQVRR